MEKITSPTEAIILSGGKGTRLKSVSGNIPKPMMPLCGKPFVEYLLAMLLEAGISRTIFALGYMPEVFREYFGSAFKGMSLDYSIEETPLDTGGALKQALECATSNNLLALNGDSYINVDITSIFSYHIRSASDITIALKHLPDCSRYGKVTFSNGRIDSFREKGIAGNGYINAGLYIVNRRITAVMPSEQAFSFETDILEKSITDLVIAPYISDGFFIDIGTPEDYRRAKSELPGLTGAPR